MTSDKKMHYWELNCSSMELSWQREVPVLKVTAFYAVSSDTRTFIKSTVASIYLLQSWYPSVAQNLGVACWSCKDSVSVICNIPYRDFGIVFLVVVFESKLKSTSSCDHLCNIQKSAKENMKTIPYINWLKNMQTAKNQTLASCLATYEMVNCRLKLLTLNWTWTVLH